MGENNQINNNNNNMSNAENSDIENVNIKIEENNSNSSNNSINDNVNDNNIEKTDNNNIMGRTMLPTILPNSLQQLTNNDEILTEINLNTSQETIELPVYSINKRKNSYGTSTTEQPSRSNSIQTTLNSAIYCLHGHRHVEIRGHCHRKRTEGVDVNARKKLIIASILCVFFIIAEVIGGAISGSLAIATDAAHLLTDFASFMISLFAIWIAGRPSTKRLSFGWYRAEVIGAIVSVFMIWVITAILVYMAIERIIMKTYEVDGEVMLFTSVFAIVVNIIMGAQLHGGGHSHNGHSHNGHSHNGHSHNHGEHDHDDDDHTNTVECGNSCETKNTNENVNSNKNQQVDDGKIQTTQLDTDTTQKKSYTLKSAGKSHSVHIEDHDHDENKTPVKEPEQSNMNVRAAFIHVIGDLIQSIGVFIAALIIYFKPEYAIADPICTLMFSVIVIITTINILKDALLVLMEGTPTYLDYAKILDIFQQIEGVERVHNLRIWVLAVSKEALSVHLAIRPGTNPVEILNKANLAVHRQYQFFETTIQIEEVTPDMDDCNQCEIPK